MRDRSLRIKNLAISIEALSRVNTPDAQTAFVSVMGLLQEEIRETEMEAYPTPPRSSNTDDEIPF